MKNNKLNITEHNCTTKLCKEYSKTDKIIIASANRKKYELENDLNLKIYKYNLDDCVFRDNIIKDFKLCDYIILFEDTFIWIELKGSHLNQACQQIINSFKNSLNLPKESNHFARIILSRVNKHDESSLSFKKIKMLFKNNFIYKVSQYSEKISNLKN